MTYDDDHSDRRLRLMVTLEAEAYESLERVARDVVANLPAWRLFGWYQQHLRSAKRDAAEGKRPTDQIMVDAARDRLDRLAEGYSPSTTDGPAKARSRSSSNWWRSVSGSAI